MIQYFTVSIDCLFFASYLLYDSQIGASQKIKSQKWSCQISKKKLLGQSHLMFNSYSTYPGKTSMLMWRVMEQGPYSQTATLSIKLTFVCVLVKMPDVRAMGQEWAKLWFLNSDLCF